MNFGHQNPYTPHVYPRHNSIGSPPCYYPQITPYNPPLISAPRRTPPSPAAPVAPVNVPPYKPQVPCTQSAGLGINVLIKPEHQLTPPPFFDSKKEVPHCTFHFDFELEKKILLEAQKWNLNCHDEVDSLSRSNVKDERSSSSSSTYFEEVPKECLPAKHQSIHKGMEEEEEEEEEQEEESPKFATLEPHTCHGMKEEHTDFTLDNDS